MNTLPTLYGKDSKGNIKSWRVYTKGSSVCIEHGKLGGKLTTKQTTSQGKNIGRANATTPEQQAQLEAKAKWNKQKKKEYAESIEAIPESTLPALAKKLQDTVHTLDLKEGVDVLCKYDGVRCSIFLKDGEIFFQSRGGEPYPVIPTIAQQVQDLFIKGNTNIVVDGELYADNMHLEDITSAVKKHNEDTPQLKFYVFDLIDKTKPNQTWKERYLNYTTPMEDAYLDGVPSSVYNKIQTVQAVTLHSLDKIYARHDLLTTAGFEGIVIRARNGKHSFGNRTNEFIKYKVRKDAEFKVTRFEKDKNNCAMPWCEITLENGTKQEFKAPLIGTQERNQQLWQKYVDNNLNVMPEYSWLKVEFENYSKYGIPAKPKGVAFRTCNNKGEPVE